MVARLDANMVREAERRAVADYQRNVLANLLIGLRQGSKDYCATSATSGARRAPPTWKRPSARRRFPQKDPSAEGAMRNGRALRRRASLTLALHPYLSIFAISMMKSTPPKAPE